MDMNMHMQKLIISIQVALITTTITMNHPADRNNQSKNVSPHGASNNNSNMNTNPPSMPPIHVMKMGK